jgi:hypothetical protein
MLKLPSKVTVGLGVLIAGGAGLTEELHLSHPIHKLILLAAGVVLFLLNPTAESPEAALDNAAAQAPRAFPPKAIP